MRRAKPAQRFRSQDRAAKHKAEYHRHIAFWAAMREHFEPEVQAVGDAAQDGLGWADLRALEGAVLVDLAERMAESRSVKARAKLRNARAGARRNLFSILLAEHPTLELGASPVLLPPGSLLGLPVAEREARQAERDALVAQHKIGLLDAALAGRLEPGDVLRTYQRDELERMRWDAEDEIARHRRAASSAWSRLAAEEAAGQVEWDAMGLVPGASAKPVRHERQLFGPPPDVPPLPYSREGESGLEDLGALFFDDED